ncbi:MAG TPA: hypothetical protein VFB72_08700 [Verrucomicrobiae bacterium]|nr:hypothetical protein [Verrucomicrobiae bacterium]
MDYFWIIPLLLAVVIVVWAFYRKVMREGGDGVRRDGKVLVDKPPKPGPGP